MDMSKISIPVSIISIGELPPDTYFLVCGSANGYYKDLNGTISRLSDSVIISHIDDPSLKVTVVGSPVAKAAAIAFRVANR